jgi:hypothetical protein
MPNTPLVLNEKEKALYFICYILRRIYPPFALLGLVIAFAVLFQGSPDSSAFLAPIIGFITAFLDINLFLHFLTTKTHEYSRRFDWYTIIRPFRYFFPFYLYRKNTKLPSKEWLNLWLAHIKSLILYGSYKVIIAAFLIIINFLITKTAETAMFNFGLCLFFWCSIYFVLWKQIYARKTARSFGITEERMRELREAMINRNGWR